MTVEHENLESFPPPGRKRKEAFIDRLAEYDWTTRETIIAAYDLAETAHRGQERSSGEPYITHPVASTVILIDECKVRDPNIIIGSLLHDTIEDTIMFGDLGKLTSSEWINIARFRLGTLFFNPEVAEIVTSLTKPKIDGKEVRAEEQRRAMAIAQLRGASPKALLVKMADRLHNLRTLEGFSDAWKAGMVVDETQNVMYDIFRRTSETYPKEHKVLEDGMREAICNFENTKSRWLFFYNQLNGAPRENS
jgi:(p)ppGpp synthase/HD superfamily hydrolase